MTKLNFKIVTPEKVVYEDEVDSVTLPAKEGEITVLPNHIPLVSSLKAGEILIRKDKDEVPLAVSGGLVEIAENNLVILADTAERFEEIDEARAEEARQKAQELIERKPEMDKEVVDYTGLAAKMEKELARLKVVRKYRKTGHRPEIKSE